MGDGSAPESEWLDGELEVSGENGRLSEPPDPLTPSEYSRNSPTLTPILSKSNCNSSMKIMETNKVKPILEAVFDMAVFSQLLEMDEELDRKVSSGALLTFIKWGTEQADAMQLAL